MMWALQSIALAACKVFSLLLIRTRQKNRLGIRISVNRLQGRSYDLAREVGSQRQAKIATLVPSRSNRCEGLA